MYLPRAEEWGLGSQEVKGTDVYSAGSGRVREEWLSRCREERALTSDMMSDVTSLSNLTASLNRVISNGGSAGVDGMSVDDLKEWFKFHYISLIQELSTNSYRVNQVRGVEIPKPKGGKRQLGIPTVKDRLVQQAIQQQLENHYDATFSKYSYGFRKGRGTSQCLSQASSYIESGYRHPKVAPYPHYYQT